MDNILYYATLDKDNRVVNIAEESTGKIRCSPNFIPIASMDTTLIGKYYYNGQFVTEAKRNLELMKTVDGSGSGLDADMLDGNDSSNVVKIDSTGKYATAPTPESTTDSSTKVATTKWVSNCETIPHLATPNIFTGTNSFAKIVTDLPVSVYGSFVGDSVRNTDATYKFKKYIVNNTVATTVAQITFMCRFGGSDGLSIVAVTKTGTSLTVSYIGKDLSDYMKIFKKSDDSTEIYLDLKSCATSAKRGYINVIEGYNLAKFVQEVWSENDEAYALTVSEGVTTFTPKSGASTFTGTEIAWTKVQ